MKSKLTEQQFLALMEKRNLNKKLFEFKYTDKYGNERIELHHTPKKLEEQEVLETKKLDDRLSFMSYFLGFLFIIFIIFTVIFKSRS